jgi:glutathione synthase/RimK-type ligase-like ATP-grasp enzyme
MGKINYYAFFLIRKIMFFIYLFRAIKLKGLFSEKETDVIIWAPIFSWKYLIRDRILMDLAHINSLSKKEIKFELYLGKNIGKFHDKIIYLAYDFEQNIFGLNDYTKQLYLIITELEKQSNIVFPTSNEFLFWENKQYMHEEFERLNISQPKTKIVSNYNEVDIGSLTFPFLIKEVHSCQSNGIFKIEKPADYLNLKSKLTGNVFLIQELLNIRRDLRVTIVGSEIVHFYWRINNQQEWKPTSTGHGSSVDFVNFPLKWKAFIISEFLKLNLATGGLDIAWQNDDLFSKPIILEVSPTYQLNPVTFSEKFIKKYGYYKKYSIWGNDSYLNQYIIQTLAVVDKIVDLRIRKIKENK